jgi:glycosyltransferase involved in cell wall biosynthesis
VNPSLLSPGARDGGLRVLQVITDRDRRGAQVFALDLAPGLQQLGANVVTVALAHGTHGDSLQIPALGRRRLGLRTLAALRRAGKQCDAVVAHGSSTLAASALALVGCRVPIVYRQISDPEFWAASRVRRSRVALYLRRIDAVVALSPSVAATFERHHRLDGRPPIAVVPNAVPDDGFALPSDVERDQARAQWGLPRHAVVMLYIGALVPEKGVERAVEVVAAIPGAVLLVAGDGPARGDLEEFAADLLPGRAFFLGSIKEPQRAYWASDVLLFPSRAGDSMPAVLIEAGLSGLPSVATDVGAIAEVVDDGATGYVVASAEDEEFLEAARRLASDPALRSEMGANAAERCAKLFTISRVAPAWMDVLRRYARA